MYREADAGGRCLLTHLIRSPRTPRTDHARGLALPLANRAHDEETCRQAGLPALALADSASQNVGEVRAQEDVETAQYESAHLKPATEKGELAVEVLYLETGVVVMNTDEDRVLALHTVLPAIG